MNNVTVTYRDVCGEIVEVFDNVVGHQVGGGSVQVILNTGVQRIINNFISVDVIPDEATQARSLKMAEQAYSGVSDDKDTSEPQEVKPETGDTDAAE